MSQANANQVLWQIGRADDSPADLALGTSEMTGYSSQFPDDCTYTVGQSRAEVDWPCILPGPLDNWAGSKPHSFVVVFQVEKTVADGDCRLVIDPFELHDEFSFSLEFRLNDFVFEKELPKFTPAISAELDVTSTQNAERTKCIPIDFPASALQIGENRLTITNISDPDNPFTIHQALYKEKFALDGNRMVNDLAAKAEQVTADTGSNVLDVFNSCSWPVTQLVTLTLEQSSAGDCVLNEQGEPIASQSCLKPSRDGQALMVRLFNAGGKDSAATLKWAKTPKKTWLSNVVEEKIAEIESPVPLVAYEIVTLRVEPGE